MRFCKLLLLIIISASGFTTQAQKHDFFWVIEDSTAIVFDTLTLQPSVYTTFASNIPSGDISPWESNFRTASVSSFIGQPLFYMAEDGNYCFDTSLGSCNVNYAGLYDRFGNTLTNGGDMAWDFGTRWNNSTFLPFDAQDSLYRVLSVGESRGTYPLFSSLHLKLFSSTIRLNDNGEWSVIEKNNCLWYSNDSSLTFQLTAVRNGNGRDWWVVVHLDRTNKFLLWDVKPDTILGPQIQHVGAIIGNNGAGCSTRPTFSNSGTILAWPCSNGLDTIQYAIGDTVFARNDGLIQFYDFDRCFGTLKYRNEVSEPSPPQNSPTLSAFTNSYSNVIFSKFDSVLYAFAGKKIMQISMRESNFGEELTMNGVSGQVDCWRSVDDVIPFPGAILCEYTGIGLLGPDGQIYYVNYSASEPQDSPDSLRYWLGVIEHPDSFGIACGNNRKGFWIGGRYASFSMPNMVNYRLGPVTGPDSCPVVVGMYEKGLLLPQILVYPNPANNRLTIDWNGSALALEVYDVAGRCMHRETSVAPRAELVTAEWPTGVYVLRAVSATGEMVSARIGVQH